VTNSLILLRMQLDADFVPLNQPQVRAWVGGWVGGGDMIVVVVEVGCTGLCPALCLSKCNQVFNDPKTLFNHRRTYSPPAWLTACTWPPAATCGTRCAALVAFSLLLLTFPRPFA